MRLIVELSILTLLMMSCVAYGLTIYPYEKIRNFIKYR